MSTTSTMRTAFWTFSVYFLIQFAVVYTGVKPLNFPISEGQIPSPVGYIGPACAVSVKFKNVSFCSILYTFKRLSVPRNIISAQWGVKLRMTSLSCNPC